MRRTASTTTEQIGNVPGPPSTIVEVEPGVCAIATWHNFVFTVWVSAGTQAAVERVARVTTKMCELHPERVTHVHLLKTGIGLPSSEARAGLVKIMKEHGTGIAACAVMIGGAGFWASAMRSTITAMRMLAPRTFEMRLHGTLEEIVEWVPDAHRQCTGVVVSAAALERVLQQLAGFLSGNLEDVQVEAPGT